MARRLTRSLLSCVAAGSTLISATAWPCTGQLAGSVADAQSKVSSGADKVAAFTCPTSGAASGECTKCQQAVKAQKSKLLGDGSGGAIQAAIVKDNTYACAASADGSASVGQTLSSQLSGALNGTALFKQGDYQAKMTTQNATELHSDFKSCQDDVSSGCRPATDDAALSGLIGPVGDVFSACGSGLAATATVAGTNATTSMNLGNMASELGAAAALLTAGASLASLMNQQAQGSGSGLTGLGSTDQSGTSGTTGSSGSSTTSSGPQSDSLGAGQVAANSASLGVKPGADTVGASQVIPNEGAGSSTGSSQPAGYGSASTGAADAASAAGAKTGSGSGSGGALGSASGSGASRGGDAARDLASVASPTAGANYEITAGGGVVNRAGMMGLKPGSTELNDLTGDAAAPALGTAAELFAAPAVAAPQGAAENEGADASESIFQRVRSRYALLAKMGRF